MDSIGENIVIVGAGNPGGILFNFVKVMQQSGVKNIAIFDLVDPRKTINEQQTLKFFKIDVRNKKQIEDAFAEVVECFGHVDVMVNGAAIIQESSFEETLKINTIGLANCCEVGIDHMSIEKNGKGGTIVNIASVVGLSPFFNLPAYTASKHAIVGYTRSLSDPIFEPKFGIRFILVCPGVTDTSFLKSLDVNGYRKELAAATDDLILKMGKQKPEVCAKLLFEVLGKSENGSAWIIENGKTSAVTFKHYNK